LSIRNSAEFYSLQVLQSDWNFQRPFTAAPDISFVASAYILLPHGDTGVQDVTPGRGVPENPFSLTHAEIVALRELYSLVSSISGIGSMAQNAPTNGEPISEDHSRNYNSGLALNQLVPSSILVTSSSVEKEITDQANAAPNINVQTLR